MRNVGNSRLASCIALLFFAVQRLAAQTILTPGDIAIIAHNNDGTDQVVFVPLVDLSTGTNIKFTDNPWTGSAFGSGEGTYNWTATSAVPRGSVVTLNTSGMSLGANGDQVFAFQGTLASPNLVYGLSSTPWISTGIPNTTNSYAPAILMAANALVAYPLEFDNGHFAPLTAMGDKPYLLGLFADPAQRQMSNNRYDAFPTWGFTVLILATEPAAQPSLLNFFAVTTYKHQVTYVAPNPPPSGYLVLRRIGGPPTGTPSDGTAYQVGDDIGDAKVAFIGVGTGFLQEGTRAGTTYGYSVFAYNGGGSLSNYRTSSPLTALMTTPATMVGSYYGSLAPSDPTFLKQLQTRIRAPYTRVAYDQFDETNVSHFASEDAALGRRNVTCVYSGQTYNFLAPFQWYTASPFSREHTFCHSWMPSYPATNTDEYSDQHHLFPVNQTNANAVRSNHPLGEVQTMISAYLSASYGRDLASNIVYEPRPQHKGDAARAILYMCLRYNGVNGLNWTLAQLNAVTLPSLSEGRQSIQTLLDWHQQDPPDAYEIARNDYVQSIQGNRNPLVDHPEWAGYVNWSNLTQVPFTPIGGDTMASPTLFAITMTTNPLSELSTLTMATTEATFATWRIMDEVGQVLRKDSLLLQAGLNEVAILHRNEFNTGFYAIQAQSHLGQATTRFLVQ